MSYAHKLIIISLIICLSLGIGMVISAQEDNGAELNGEEIIEEVIEDETVEPEDLDVEEPKLLPNSPFYFVKEWGRAIQSFFAFGQMKKSETEQQFANERLIELKTMIEAGEVNEKVLEKATEKYEKSLEKIQRHAEKLKETAEENEEINEFFDKFTKHQLLHQRILQKLEEQVPEEIIDKIKQARETHLEKFGEIITKLEERKEKIKEKIEEALEQEKGSKFKNFKNLERLMEIEEKVPEQTKEAIRQAQENALKRLKGDLEKMSSEDQERFNNYIERIFGDKETQNQILERIENRIEDRVQLKEFLNEAKEKIEERIEIREREMEQNSGSSSACITLWNPVCGKDGKTYSNECFARQARVEIDYKGKCEPKLEPQLNPFITPCRNLWWHDNTSQECQQRQFCGAYMYAGLRTFETKGECEESLAALKPEPSPLIIPPQCRNLWWHDNTSQECQQRQFCGAYMYAGLRTFETKGECEESLYLRGELTE